MATSARSNAITILATTALILVVFLWLATPYITEKVSGHKDLASQGMFGDLFGSVNALFSGLAFLGVLAALSFQWMEIRGQDAAIKATQELQEKTLKALVDSMYASSFMKVYEILDDESVIAARQTVRLLSETAYKDWHLRPGWADEEKQIKTLLRAYNMAGIIVKHGFLPQACIVPDWEPSLRSTWNTLKPYVLGERKARESVNHWANYEWLVEIAKEYVAVNPQPLS